MTNKAIEKTQNEALQKLEREITTFIVGNDLQRKIGESQTKLCLQTALAWGLNPLKREIHFIPYWNSGAGKYEVKIVVGYEVYLKKAERSGKLNGWKVDIQGSGDDMKAIVTIYRKDWEYPFVHEVYFNEVKQTKKTERGEELSPTWAKMPKFMLKKVAIAQAFRLAFPEEIGGLPYIPEEISEIEESTPLPSIKEFKEAKQEEITQKEVKESGTMEDTAQVKKSENNEEQEAKKEEEKPREEEKKGEPASPRQIMMIDTFIKQGRLDPEVLKPGLTQDEAKELIRKGLKIKPKNL